MSDLTILYITASEMPDCWLRFQLDRFKAAAQRYPVISVSRQPLHLGTNLLDDEPKSYWNIYMQMLRSAKMARTPFVAMAEDDVLYTLEHFRKFRPSTDAVSYDRSRWSLFAWEPQPIFCLRNRLSNCSLIAPRELLIHALEERAAKWPDGAPNSIVGEVGRESVSHRLGVAHVKCEEWWCREPIVHLNHLTGTDTGDYGHDAQGRHWTKPHGQIKAIEIPLWGRAADIVKHYHEPSAH